MIGVIYLLLATILGRLLFEWLLSAGFNRCLAKDFNGDLPRVPRAVVIWPASFVLGTLVLTWFIYALGCFWETDAQPLYRANRFGLIVLVLSLLVVFIRARETVAACFFRPPKFKGHYIPWVLTFSLLTGSTALMWQTLHIATNHQLVVGLSVFSDFGPHLAVIRSFSHGKNFPTEYPHFPTGHARYHFMFQFLSGNLEYLGLPLDWAFNLPSILSFTSCLLLLYALAVLLTGSRLAGVLSILFFFFRSSLAWWDLLIHTKPAEWFSYIVTNDTFLGNTEHEEWGLWSQNIYVNQRHLAFALCLLWLTVVLVLPYIREGLSVVRNRATNGFWKNFFLSKAAWWPAEGFRVFIALGIFLGLAAFWNGAVVIGALLLLFGLTFWSRARLGFGVLALFSLVLAFAQNRLFLGPSALAIQPHIEIGFLAAFPHDVHNIVVYYFSLLGLLPFAVIGALILLRKQGGLALSALATVFVLPTVLATTVQFTPDIAINHKYVFLSIVLFNIIAAGGVACLWSRRNALARSVAVAATFCLTATGAIDLVTLIHRNASERALIVDLQDPLLVWAERNTRANEVFLTDWYSLHPILLSGRRIFYGWPYYAWGAGYDVRTREEIVKAIYGGTDPETVRSLLRENGLRYIIIDAGNREQKLYKLNETLLRSLFPVVFSNRDLVVLRTDTP